MFFFLTVRERKSLSMCQLSNYRQESSQCAFLDHLKTLVFSLCESDDSGFWNAFFFSIAFFQLENPFFVNAGSALDEVSIPLWSAFKQVWQQAASLLSSWCNHLNRSNHAVWNDLFVGFLLPKVFEIFRLVWSIWYVYKDLLFEDWVVVSSLPAIVVDGSKSFSFPGCSLIRIVSSTRPGSVSLARDFTRDKSVAYL